MFEKQNEVDGLLITEVTLVTIGYIQLLDLA